MVDTAIAGEEGSGKVACCTNSSVHSSAVLCFFGLVGHIMWLVSATKGVGYFFNDFVNTFTFHVNVLSGSK